MKYLITGGAGFVGSALARQLVAKDEDVYLILRKGSDSYRIKSILDKVHIEFCDLTDEVSVKNIFDKIKPDIVYHLATHGVYPGQDDEKIILNNNITSTLNLLRTASSVENLNMFVNTGSFLEYGPKDKQMKEDDLPEPNNCYAISKVSQTLLCQYYALKNAFPIINVRLFATYGPYEGPTRLMPTLIKSCLEGKEIVLTAPEVARDFIYIDDAVDMLLRIINFKEFNGNIFNCCSGKQSTLKEVAKLVKRLTGSDVDIKFNATVGRPWDTKISIGSPEKSKKILSWQYRNDLSEGLSKTIEHFKNFYKLK